MNPKKLFRNAGFVRPYEEIEHLDDLYQKLGEEDTFFIFVGRSNVGKSSLINALYGKKLAKTSNTPGRTQSLNLFNFKTAQTEEKDFFFIDLPGFGHAKVSKEMKKKWDQIFNEFFFRLPPNALVIHIQDSRHPFTKIDDEFLSFIERNQGRSLLLMNKFDKLKRQKDRALLDKTLKAKKETITQYGRTLKVSAESGLNVDKLEEYLMSLLS
ncbi:MAG: ribosome biogenesis GTP-binding protein YihA/YsxC [Bacteriovoracaceae bacterium]